MTGVVPDFKIVRPGDITCVPVGGDAGKLIRWAQNWADDGKADPRALACQHATIHLGRIEERIWTYRNGNVRDLAHRGWTGPGWYVAEALTTGAHLRCVGADARSAVAEAGPDAIWTTGVLPLLPAQRLLVCDKAISALGTPYGFEDYLWLAIYRRGVRFPGLKQLMANPNRMICSQYADWSRVGIADLFNDGRPIGDVMPSDIAGLVLSARS